MRLWSFQSHAILKNIEEKAAHTVEWDYFNPSSNWMVAYRWMANEMTDRRIGLGNRAPIWAFHSCGALGGGPTLDDARGLLSDNEIQTGTVTIEFECPSNLALLSDYAIWNRVLDEFLDHGARANIDAAMRERLFSNPDFRDGFGCIQASVPLIRKEWIIETRPLPLEPWPAEYDADAFA